MQPPTGIARDLAIMRSQQLRHFVQLIAADFVAMRASFPKLLQMAAARDFKTTTAWAHYFWGCASYLQNYLGEADEHFRAVLDLADYANTLAYTHSAIGLALTAPGTRRAARSHRRRCQCPELFT